MNLVKNFSITKRMTFVFAFIFSITLFCLSTCVLYSVELYQFFSAHNDIETTKKYILTDNIKLSDIENGEALYSRKDILVEIRNKDGILFKTTAFIDGIEHSVIPYDRIAVKELEDEDFLIEKTKCIIQDITYDAVIIKDLHDEKVFLKILFSILALVDLVGIIIALISGYIFAKKALKPIDIIIKTSRNISYKGLSERIPLPESRDELYELSLVLNNMADKLECIFNKQAQFVSDASHELKTPLAAIIGHASLISRWGKDDREVLEKSILAITTEAEYMENLITKLLYLAKLDNEKAVMIEPFNLSELIATIYKDVSMCNENFEIICTCEPNVQINTDKAMTKQLILILLDNALKFTDSNGTIAINCISNDEKVVLEIIDSGCGMCEDELALIFDRFYTNDKARNRTSSGNGLGLSIAKEICELLSLEISVSSILNEGSKFQLIFPKF